MMIDLERWTAQRLTEWGQRLNEQVQYTDIPRGVLRISDDIAAAFEADTGLSLSGAHWHGLPVEVVPSATMPPSGVALIAPTD
jgi:hypothetical protein